MSTQKISHVSASQFKTFSLCQRKWYIEKCTDTPRPEPSAAMLLGSAVHELLEEYVSNGVEIEGARSYSPHRHRTHPRIYRLKRRA